MPLTLTLSADQTNAALVYSGHERWPGLVITYSIPGGASVWSASSYPAGDEPSNAAYGVLDADQASWFQLAVSSWDRLVRLDIQRVADNAVSQGDIRIAITNTSDYSDDDPAAYAYQPPDPGTSAAAFNGDIWLDNDFKGADAEPGTFLFATMLHELGHALGLKHPFDGAATLPADYDNTRWTVMAYNQFADSAYRWYEKDDQGFHAYFHTVQPTTPMPLDVAALQSIYGAATVAPGDDTYRIDDARPLMMTLVDSGGIDTLDLSDSSGPCDVNLTPGSFSSVGIWTAAEQIAYWTGKFPDQADTIRQLLSRPDTYTWSNNLATSLGTVIENVVGGDDNDTVQGNAADNHISGGAGADRLLGGLGNDTLEGGAAGPGGNYLRGDEGNDSIVGGAGFDDINGNQGNDTCVSGGGDDWVVGGKDNDSLMGSDGANLVYGNLGSDTCDGGAGNDIVRGGQDNDSCLGGAGDDFVSGDKGDDTMTGGAGADVFHTFGDAGIDRVLDFHLSEGDRVQLDPGAQFTVSQVGADTVINMTGGGQMVLVGVTMATLTGSWIFGA